MCSPRKVRASSRGNPVKGNMKVVWWDGSELNVSVFRIPSAFLQKPMELAGPEMINFYLPCAPAVTAPPPG